MNKKISIIVACYNEEKNIPLLYERTIATMQQLTNYDYEIIFVDNASTDQSKKSYDDLIKRDKNVTTIFMSRNFGNSQPSIIAGMHHAQGDAVVILNGGLQDPPELIFSFISYWQQGYDVVYGIAQKRSDNSFIRRLFYKAFYRVFRMLSYLDIPLDSGDYCLMARNVVDVINKLPEKDIYLRGLRTWVGFAQIGIPYQRTHRPFGKSSNSFWANFWWAKKAIVNFSDKPLEYISLIAIATSTATVFVAIVYLYLHFSQGAPRGFSTLLMVMFVFGSLQLLCLSIIGEYLMRMFHEIKNRPIYIIKEIKSQKNLNEES